MIHSIYGHYQIGLKFDYYHYSTACTKEEMILLLDEHSHINLPLDYFSQMDLFPTIQLYCCCDNLTDSFIKLIFVQLKLPKTLANHSPHSLWKWKSFFGIA